MPPSMKQPEQLSERERKFRRNVLACRVSGVLYILLGIYLPWYLVFSGPPGQFFEILNVMLLAQGAFFIVLGGFYVFRAKAMSLRSKKRPGACEGCGYSLDGLGEADRCPECGAALDDARA